jgi:MoaA/NifB/PqqE/SkfB family radical SAM enzyme
MKLIKNFATRFAIKKIANSLSDDSDESILKVIKLLAPVSGKHKSVLKSVEQMVHNKTAGIKLVKRILSNTNKKCREKLAVNLISNGLLIRESVRDQEEKDGGCTPTTLLISPTMRCNIKCIGCYAANYDMTSDMEPAVFKRLLKESEEMGVAFITILGGEPFVYPNLLQMVGERKDMYFNIFTNGTMMTDDVVEKLKEVGNVFVTFSIEGFKDDTDQRRGKGVYEKVLDGMAKLKEAGIPFGYSVCVTNKNIEKISSDEFVDDMIERGAFLMWFFLYMPVGGKPDISLMPTPKQRKFLLDRDRHIRETRPVFVIDFWNDAPMVGGCIAGKRYAHVTNTGDVEPCIFTHMAQDNINDKSLREVMRSPYFKELRKRQPYNDNLYLPCQWIDHPEVSRELHKKFNLKLTHPGADDILVDKDIRKGIDKYSKEVRKLYEKIWAEECNNNCGHCGKH